MKHKHTYILTTLFVVIGFNIQSSYAQENLNESLTVEGEYDATIRHQERINISPLRANISLPKASLPFASSGVEINESPEIFALPVTGWQTTRQFNNHNGYFDFGIGSYLNIVGSAGYRFLNDEKISAGIMLQHNSTSLFSPFEYQWNNPNTNLPEKAARKRSDSQIGTYGSFSFGTGRLLSDINYHYGNFNYYGLPQQYIENYGEIPTQQLNDFRLNTKWIDKISKHDLSYNLNLIFHHFGYQNAYNLNPDETLTKRNTQKENHLTIAAGLNKAWDKNNAVGIDINADLLFYTNNATEQNVDDYANFQITPFYRLQQNNLNIIAGANIDITTETKNLISDISKKNRFSGTHISPNIQMSWRKSNIGIYVHALGGVELNTLASNYHLDYYQSPSLNSTIPTYSPIDGRIGISFSALQGLSADISFAYKITDNAPLGGTYLLPEQKYDNIDIKGFSIAADIKYEFMNRAKIELSGSYQPQNAEKGYFNGYDRPRWILNTKGSVNVWESLNLFVSYQYRGVRNLYVMPQNATTDSYKPIRLDDIYKLNIGASYKLLNDKLTLWGEANNILGSTAGLSPLFENEGFNFLLGVGMTF